MIKNEDNNNINKNNYKNNNNSINNIKEGSKITSMKDIE